MRRFSWLLLLAISPHFALADQPALDTKAVKQQQATTGTGQVPLDQDEFDPANPGNVAIVLAIIEASIRSWSGNCACPQQTDSMGRRCGGRSAYSRAGGYKPLACSPADVTREMISSFRSSAR